MSTLPPLQPFNRQLVNTVMRTTYIKTLEPDSLEVTDFTATSLFSAYPQLVSCFKEVKIQKVKIWVIPSLGTASSGIYTLCVAPKSEVNGKDNFNGLSQTPGSITRKVFQTAHAMYYPTEPDERNWFSVTLTKQLFTVQVICTGLDQTNSVKQPSMQYQIVCDAHVRLRGRASSITDDKDFIVVERLKQMST